jgi:hypothetical protein
MGASLVTNDFRLSRGLAVLWLVGCFRLLSEKLREKAPHQVPLRRDRDELRLPDRRASIKSYEICQRYNLRVGNICPLCGFVDRPKE